MGAMKYARGLETLKLMTKDEPVQPAPLSFVPVHQPKPPVQLRYETLFITPEIAQKMLESHNIHNRPVSDERVKLYAEIMKAGNWNLNGEPIAYSISGRLVNGQHRLFAAVLYGASFWATVTYGVSEDAFATYDVGGKRTAGQILQIADLGFKSPRTVAAAIRLIMRYDRDKLANNKSVTEAEVLAFAKQNLGIGPIVDAALKTTPRKLHTYAATVGAVAYLAGRRYSVRVHDFLRGYQTGADLSDGNPILALRSRFQDTVRMLDRERMAITAYAWNAFIENRKIKRLQTPKEKDGFPLIKGAGER